MTPDKGAPIYPAVLVSDTGAPPGLVYIHCEASGATILAPRDNYLPAIRDINRRD